MYQRPFLAFGKTWLFATIIVAGTVLVAPVWTQTGDRVVAIGDVHGAGNQFTRLLKQSGLVDDQQHWAGGSTTFVQTGDFTDRGTQVREVMDLLMRLEDEAAASGGESRALLGNHETMNLTANVRDATPEIFATFAAADAEERQYEAYDQYVGYVQRREQALGRPLPDRQTRDEWMAAHPIGFVEYMEAFGPRGRYGRWLRTRPIATTVSHTIFLHGGLAPDLRADTVENLNRAASDEIAKFDAFRSHLVEQDVILAFSTFQEIVTAVALELDAWLVRLFPGPPRPGAPPSSLTSDERAHLELLVEFQNLGAWSIVDANGPLWFRGFARWSAEEGNQLIAGVLDRFGVTRAVVGHSVTATRRITPRFGGRVFLIDTGMLTGAYQGRASALEILGTEVNAIYLDERVPLLQETAPAK